ncbi:MAG: ABC transporter permease subunit, partial [Candidatus Nanopelagicales bacterium]
GILLAILGAVVAEFLGSQEGLGNMVLVAQYNFETPTMFAVLIVLSLMGILAHIIVRIFQKRVAFWADNSHIVGT